MSSTFSGAPQAPMQVQQTSNNTRVKWAVICASNMNRSMEAHSVLKNAGLVVRSFGTGTAVRLPGPAIDKPNVYPFGTPYESIYRDLESKDKTLYTQNGLLNMLDRNRRVKTAPERFQENNDFFDVIITCEERCFDAVVEDILDRGNRTNQPVHVINVEIRDNHEEAAIGGQLISQIASQIEQAQDLNSEIEQILERFQTETGSNILYTVAYY
ncbi:hypothetical protein SmJEL517_g03407 [Synchytrium microbalum]|uniref:RNA polymerase II subunit A C-terminal domain phosphatase SSU72 n=1 Tax=Synchytrium microbalum TaxID=1806994 RepID=A0A507BWK0_9FUNG|nr:uncharacterized protein SmJEL517_g03407 [Synchytrium microbalum]TPX33730.1 hypothetical protein SmJEL517_g03407 [Synchytrium microbalum]